MSSSPCDLIKTTDVFLAVQNSRATYGVVPFENSSNGSVVYTLDLLIDRENRVGDVVVCGEAFLPVHHCLLGHATPLARDGDVASVNDASATNDSRSSSSRGRPLIDLSRIKRVLSHPQAFGQCEIFLSTYLKGVERQEVSSTSKAAEIVAGDTSGTSAAISSSLAAGIQGLDVLAEGIHDRDDNTTRFFILRKGPSLGDHVIFRNQAVPEPRNVRYKTMISFRIDHRVSGALVDALFVFKPFDLNLTSINSRPSRIRPWHYIFLIECEGKRDEDGNGSVNGALGELGKRTLGWRWLGSWVNRVSSSTN